MSSDIKVVFIPGIGGIDAYAQEAIDAFIELGFDVEAIGWTKYPAALMILNFFDKPSQRAAIERVKNILSAHKATGKRVVIVSHSRGASIHSKALVESKLVVDLSVQMAAGYHSEKLLEKSVELSRRNAFLTSAKDTVLLSGIFLHGRALLGRNGPSSSIPNMDIHSYNLDWHQYNHQGSHEHFLRSDFIKGFVSPLIRSVI